MDSLLCVSQDWNKVSAGLGTYPKALRENPLPGSSGSLAKFSFMCLWDQGP